MCIVNEAVEDRVGERGLCYDFAPLLDGNLTGDEGGGALVTILEDFEEIALFGVGEPGQPPNHRE